MFESILGNDQIKAALISLSAAGRVPNAMLFAGPEGIGKRLFALELARIFACSESGGDGACGECGACRRIDTFEIPEPADKNKDQFQRVFFGRHADVGMVVAYKRFILVEAIRALEREAYFRPYEARERTFIIDEAEKLNDAASNALLKTLEEPAPTSRIILTTSRPETLLPTIRSRCQVFRFSPVRNDVLERFLVEKRSFDPADASLAARCSEGRVGAAVALDAAFLRERRKLLVEILRRAYLRRDRAGLIALSERLNEARNKEHFESDIELLLTLVRDAWMIALSGRADDIVHTEVAGELLTIAKAVEPKQLADAMTEIESFRAGFAVNLNRKIGTDNLLLKMAA